MDGEKHLIQVEGVLYQFTWYCLGFQSTEMLGLTLGCPWTQTLTEGSDWVLGIPGPTQDMFWSESAQRMSPSLNLMCWAWAVLVLSKYHLSTL